MTRAVNGGTLDEKRVDDMVRRIMTAYFYLNQNHYSSVDGYEPTLNSRYPPYQYSFTLSASNVDVRDNHAQSIRDLGAAGTVLLNDTLPLSAPAAIGVFGNDASDVVNGLYFSGAPSQNSQCYGRRSL